MAVIEDLRNHPGICEASTQVSYGEFGWDASSWKTLDTVQLLYGPHVGGQRALWLSRK